MSGRIPDDVIDDLRRQADIVEVIGGYISLKKQGQNYTGLCPFHQEKTPSFVVSPIKQIFHCFGCGKGGNVFTFLMEHDGTSFQEAAEKLAARYGVALPEEDRSPAQKQREDQVKRLRQVNLWAMEIYQEAMKAAEGKPGRDYFESRGLTEDTIRRFCLGYAPDQWDYLSNKLLEREVRDSELLLLGLSTKSSRGSLVDKFRGRVMFPILNDREQVTGFGGRVIGDGQPKYLNTQETPLFYKGKGLFGLHAAKNAIRQMDQAIVMEGYMDVLAAHQHGVANAVASLGTSLTADQAKLLTAYTYRTLICYDSDAAGEAAALRGLEVLDKQGCMAGVIRIPAGKDPDDFLKGHGKEEFLELADKSLSSFEFKFQLSMEKHDRDDMSGKVAIIQSVLPDLAGVRSPVARQGYISSMSDTLRFPEHAIHDELRRYLGGYQKRDATAPDRAPEIALRGAETLAQSNVIRSLLQDLGKQKDIEAAGGEALFALPAARNLYQTLNALVMAGYVDLKEDDLVALIDREEERQWLTGILLEDRLPGDEQKVYRDSLLTLQRQRLDRHINRVMSELTAAEKAGNASAAKEMMTVLTGLNMEKHGLRIVP
ncbi:MAG: DNA primase [Clostridiales bacterium]|nr:DNA primase [Clostridiales bacterium]